jgi:hypothetical protein
MIHGVGGISLHIPHLSLLLVAGDWTHAIRRNGGRFHKGVDAALDPLLPMDGSEGFAPGRISGAKTNDRPKSIGARV